jgi:hypothetical protein
MRKNKFHKKEDSGFFKKLEQYANPLLSEVQKINIAKKKYRVFPNK